MVIGWRHGSIDTTVMGDKSIARQRACSTVCWDLRAFLIGMNEGNRRKAFEQIASAENLK